MDNHRVMYSYFVDNDDSEYKGGWQRDATTPPGVYTPADTAIRRRIRTPRLRGRRGPAHRAVGAHRPADRAAPLLLVAVRRRLQSPTSPTSAVAPPATWPASDFWRGRIGQTRSRPGSTDHRFRRRARIRAVPHAAVGPDDLDNVETIQAGYRAAVAVGCRLGIADAWAEFDAAEKDKVDTGQVSSADFFGTAADLEGQLPVPNGRRRARHLRQHRRGGHLSGFVQRLHRCAAHRREQLHLSFSARAAAPGEHVLVADHVRATEEPVGGQPDQPVPGQLADRCPAWSKTRTMATRSSSSTTRPALSSRPTGCPRRRGRSSWCCGCTAPSPRRSAVSGRHLSRSRSSL